MRQALRVRQFQLDVYVLPTAWGGPETDACEDEASYGERRIASSPWTWGPEHMAWSPGPLALRRHLAAECIR
jgi:hypothetical protein